MTPRQIELVQSSWQLVVPVAEDAAQLFYVRLFTLDPALRGMFRGDMQEQGKKLMAMIDFAVKALARLDSLLPGLRMLGERHGRYGVRDEHYDTVAEALLWTLHKGLGAAFTPEVREAWVAAYGVLAGTMKEAARVEAAA
jgi:hemoglobin-like flavoprotein